MKIIGKIFAVLLSIVFFFGITLFGGLVFGRNFLDAKYYEGIISSIPLEEVKVKDIGLDEMFEGVDEDATLEDVIVSKLKDTGIDSNVATSILENPKAKEVMGKVISGIANSKLTGEEIPSITKEDIKSVLDIPEVKNLVGDVKVEEYIDDIVNMVNEFMKEV